MSNFDEWVIARTELTTPTSTDLIPIVDDVGGTPSTKKVTAANLATYFGAGGSLTVYTPEDDGAVGDGTTLKISTTASSATVTAVHPNPADNFTSALNGKKIWIVGAGTAGALYSAGTITYVSATQLSLSPAPATTVAAAKAVIGTDDTTALQTWLDRGGTGVELRGTTGKKYIHSAVIDATGVDNFKLDLNGAELVAVTENASEVLFSGIDGLELTGGIISCPMTTERGNEYEDQKVRITGCTRVWWHHQSIQESMAAGCYFEGNDGFVVDSINIQDTRADGIHITGGSANGLVFNVHGVGIGDDSVSIVSYSAATPSTLCRNVHVSNCSTYFPYPQGRGFTIVGADECGFTNCHVNGSRQAGFYIAVEGSFDTHNTTRCYIKGGSVKDSTRDPIYDHPSIFIYNGKSGVVMTDILVEGVEVINSGNNTGATAVKVGNDAGSGGTFSGIQLGTTGKPIKVTGTYWDDAYSSDVGSTGVTTNIELGPRALKHMYLGWTTVNPGSLTAGANPSSFTVSVPGVGSFMAVIGIDHAGSNGRASGILWWGYVTAADTVTVFVQNVNSSGSITVGSGDVTVMVAAW